MSTVIRPAYRLKKSSDLWQFTRDTYQRGEAEVKKVIREFYAELAKCVDPNSDRYKELAVHYKEDWKVRLEIAHDTVRNEYKKQLGSSSRNPFNFDVHIAIREYKSRIYVRPHCDWKMANVLDFLEEDERLEEYSYWNNTDRPKRFSAQEWGHRSKVWDGIHEAGWGHYLSINICDWSKWYLLDPYFDIIKDRMSRKKRNG